MHHISLCIMKYSSASLLSFSAKIFRKTCTHIFAIPLYLMTYGSHCSLKFHFIMGRNLLRKDSINSNIVIFSWENTDHIRLIYWIYICIYAKSRLSIPQFGILSSLSLTRTLWGTWMFIKLPLHVPVLTLNNFFIWIKYGWGGFINLPQNSNHQQHKVDI